MNSQEHCYLRNQPVLTSSDRARWELAKARGHLQLFTRPMVMSIYSLTPSQVRELIREDVDKCHAEALAMQSQSVIQSPHDPQDNQSLAKCPPISGDVMTAKESRRTG